MTLRILDKFNRFDPIRKTPGLEISESGIGVYRKPPHTGRYACFESFIYLFI